MCLGDSIKIGTFFIVILFFLIVPFVQAATIVNLEVAVLAPGMEQIIDARLGEEFTLNGKIRQRAVITESWGEYENLVLELSAVRDGTGGPEADIRIRAMKNGAPVSMNILGMDERSTERVFGADLELRDFMTEGGECVGARFVMRSQPLWSKIFSESMRRMFFVL